MKPLSDMDDRTRQLYIAATIAESVLSKLSQWFKVPTIADTLLRLAAARAAFRVVDGEGPFEVFVENEMEWSDE